MSAFRGHQGIFSHYFYCGKWSDEPSSSLVNASYIIRKSKLAFAEKFPSLANVAFDIERLALAMYSVLEYDVLRYVLGRRGLTHTATLSWCCSANKPPNFINR